MQPDVTAVATHTARLVQTLSTISHPGAASLCEGWTRGHVATHVARNAEAIGRLADWAVTGSPQEMYPGGSAARDTAIEAGAGRGVDALRADVVDTAEALAPRLERLTGALAADQVEMRGGLLVPARILPFLRLREVVFHHVDLDAGFTFADVEPDLLRRFIDDAVARLRRDPGAPALHLTSSEGDTWTTGESTAPVTGDLAGILLWLARRTASGVSSDGPLPDLPRGS